MKQILQIFLLIWMLILFPGVSANAQEIQYTESLADAQSYQFYMQKNWPALIKSANEALKQNIDFYYLRARLGIAYFESGKYAQAIPHLKKAFKTDANDVMREYLYYAYLYSGNEVAAAHMAANMPFDVKRRLELNGKLLSIGLSGFYQPVNDYTSLIVTDLNQSYNLIGRQSVLKNRTEGQIAFRIRNKSGLLNFSLQTLYSTMLLRLQNEGDTLFQSDGRTIQQAIQLSNGFKLTDQLNLYAGAAILLGSTQDIEYFETGSYGGGFGGGFSTTEAGYFLNNISFSEFVLHSSLEFKSPYVDIPVGFSYMRSYLQNHLLAEAQATVYPMANQKLYFNAGYIAKMGTNGGYLFKLKVGAGFFNKLWLEALYWNGEINHFTSDFGASIYNGEETINTKMALNVTVPLKKMDVYITAEQYSGQLPYYYEIVSGTEETAYKPINTQLLYAGIRWKINK